MTLTAKQWKWCGQIRVLIPRAVPVAFGINAAKTAMHSCRLATKHARHVIQTCVVAHHQRTVRV